MKNPRYLSRAVGLAVLCALALSFSACSKKEEPAQGSGLETPSITASARKAPDFTATTVDGTKVSLADFRGKVVLLDFWATWCPPCQAAIPHLSAMQDKFRDKGLVVLGLSVDNDVQTVKKFLKSSPVSYTMAMAPDSSRSDYRVSSIPRLFVVDKEGNVKGDFLGFSEQIGANIEASAVAAMNR